MKPFVHEGLYLAVILATLAGAPLLAREENCDDLRDSLRRQNPWSGTN